MLATVSSDYHYLPTAILRDLLRFRGFEVQDLGANSPSGSIVDRAAALDDLLAIGLSATNPGSDDIVRETLVALEAVDVPAVGRAVPLRLSRGQNRFFASCRLSYFFKIAR